MPNECVKNDWLKSRQDYFNVAKYSVQGGDAYINKYLVKHTRESTDHFDIRKKAALNINLVQKVISVLTSFIVKNIERIPSEKDADFEVYQSYIESIDFENTLNELIENKIADYLTQGNAFVIVDSLQNDRAYTLDIDYLQILDFQKGFKSLNYIDIYFNKDSILRYFANEIKRTNTEGYAKDTWIESFPNPLGEIPFVAITKKIDVSRAYFEDAMYINRAIFNQYNSVNQQLLDTGFSILAIPGTSQRNKDDAIETSPYIKFSPGSPVLPHFIAPPTQHLDFHLTYINHLTNQFLSSLNIYREQNTNPQSGLSKSYDYSIMNALLSKLAMKFEAFEKSIWTMIAKYDTRIKLDKIKIDYKTDFDVKSLNEELENAMKVLSIGISPTFDKTIEKKIAARFVSADDEDLQTIIKEIDEKDITLTVNDEFDKKQEDI